MAFGGAASCGAVRERHTHGVAARGGRSADEAWEVVAVREQFAA